MRLYLIRNARPVPRGEWRGEAMLRPLGERGFDGALAIAEHLAEEPIARVIASPMLRCQQTLEPLAVARGLPVEVDDRLDEDQEVAAVLELLQTLGDEPVVLCTHGSVISSVLAALELGEPGTDGRVFCKKGSIWRLEGAASLAERGAYFEPLREPLREPVREPVRDRASVSARSIAAGTLRVGVLDLGSTSFNLQIADVGSGQVIRPVVREKVMLRLGAVVAESPRIPEDVCERAVEVAAELFQVARQEKVQHFLAVGTAALRQAKNGSKLARRISKRLREPVRILSGKEEARAIFRAFQCRLGLGDTKLLGVDLGGGSLELALGHGTEIDLEATFELGALRLQGEFATTDPISAASLKAIRKRVKTALSPERAAILAAKPERVVVAGGSVRALWQLAAEGESPGAASCAQTFPHFSKRELSRLTKRLVASDHEERLTMRGMRRSRVDSLPTAAIILECVADFLKIDGYTVCDWGLREGVILEARDNNWAS